MATSRVPVLMICGPPGVGKSTVSWAVFDVLLAHGARPALVDLDLLGACWSFPADDPHNDRLKTRNLHAVWENYRAVGTRCLVIDGVVDDRDAVDRYCSAVPGADPTVCGLRATADELTDRIRRRGRDRGSDLDKLTRRSVELAAALATRPVADFHVETDGVEVAEVARRVLAGAGSWLG